MIAGNTYGRIALLLCLALAGCENSTQSPSSLDLGELQASRTYRVERDKLIYEIRAVTVPSCSGSTLLRKARPLRSDTNINEISQDTLRLVGDTIADGSVNAMDVTRLIRIGSGTGLEGTWRYVGSENRILSGAYGPDDLVARERQQAYNGGMREIVVMHHVFGNGEIRAYYKADFSAIFIYNWTHSSFRSYPDSTAYAISVRAIDAKAVEMKGLVSGEIVIRRIGPGPDYGTTISSDNPAHPASVHYVQPRSCPHLQQPEWYGAFLKANRK